MSWRAQNRSKDAKTPSVAGVWSQNPEPDCCPIQPYHVLDTTSLDTMSLDITSLDTISAMDTLRFLCVNLLGLLLGVICLLSWAHCAFSVPICWIWCYFVMALPIYCSGGMLAIAAVTMAICDSV